MKMHASKFKDPWISRAQPVTVIVPLVEEALRNSGVPPRREQILDCFMNGMPRVAVVHGGEDHPPNAGMRDTIRRVIRGIWSSEALPFEVVQSIPSEELSQGTEAANYGLLSRNLCAASLGAQMESHGYDAAIVIGACDKMLVGNLRGLVETDYSRQRHFRRPVFAMVLPSWIGREARMTEEDRMSFSSLLNRMPELETSELNDLLHRPLGPDVYASIKFILDRCYEDRVLQESEKNDLEHTAARSTSNSGASCAASKATIVHRLIVAALGLVPKNCDITNRPVSDPHLQESIQRLIAAIRKRERKVSVSNLIRANLANAAVVWSAAAGSPSWILHLSYLADAIGRKLDSADVLKRGRSVPQILSLDSTPEESAYALAAETDSGGNSGIDTMMRTLSEKRLIEDRAITLDGTWAHRIVEARSANGRFLHSTMTPISKSCGLSSVHGNVCREGIVRIGKATHNGVQNLRSFDRKVYLAVTYLGIRELQGDLKVHGGINDRLKRKISRQDLYDTWKLNWYSLEFAETARDMANWSKGHLWDYLVEQKLLRTIVVVAGAGPHAAGMPELEFSNEIVVTDGRVSLSHEGIAIVHVVPEAIDDGPIAAIRTGDWIHLDFESGELQVVCRKNHGGFKILSQKELMNRPDRRKRVNELARLRNGLLPSFRFLLENVTSAESGVSPCKAVL